MSLYQNLITMQLAAPDDNGISASQSLGAAGNLLINGALASGGIATLDVPRRVLITSAGNDSSLTWIVTGTGANGLSLTESLAGGNAVGVYTNHDFSTVTSIHGSAATASTVIAGTNGIASSVPIIMDTIVNPATYGAAAVVSGTVNYSIEKSYDDFAPLFDLNANTPTWFPTSGFSGQTTNQSGTIAGPCTMIRLTVNDGTGSVSMKLIKPLIAGPS
jgi:hypothetical protein